MIDKERLLPIKNKLYMYYLIDLPISPLNVIISI